MSIPLKEIAHALNKIGATNYDLRKRIGKRKQAKIEKEYAKYKEIVDNPEAFQKVRVGKETAKKIKATKHAIQAPNKAFYIPKPEGTEKLHVKKGKIVIDTKRESYKVDLDTGEIILDKLRRLALKKLPKNVMVTAQIGNRPPFQRSRFSSYQELLDYFEYVFDPNDDDFAWPMVTIVEIKVNKPLRQTRKAPAKTKGTPVKTRGGNRGK